MIDLFLQAMTTPECELTIWMRAVLLAPILVIVFIVVGAIILWVHYDARSMTRPTVDDLLLLEQISRRVSQLTEADAHFISRLMYASIWTDTQAQRFDEFLRRWRSTTYGTS